MRTRAKLSTVNERQSGISQLGFELFCETRRFLAGRRLGCTFSLDFRRVPTEFDFSPASAELVDRAQFFAWSVPPMRFSVLVFVALDFVVHF